MSKMDSLKNKTRQELLVEISSLKGQLLVLRFQQATGQLSETHEIKNLRNQIARVFTALKEKERMESKDK